MSTMYPGHIGADISIRSARPILQYLRLTYDPKAAPAQARAACFFVLAFE